jgi:hypothetical protein
VSATAKTRFRVVEIIVLGPRWSTGRSRRRWVVHDGPYHREVAGPFTSRGEALDALADLVNEAYEAGKGAS